MIIKKDEIEINYQLPTQHEFDDFTSGNRMKIDVRAVTQLKNVELKDGASLFKILVDLYASDSPRHLSSIKQSIADDDLPTLEHSAHILKSSSAQLGAIELADTFRQLENVGKGLVDWDCAPSLYAQAHQQFSQALRLLYRHL